MRVSGLSRIRDLGSSEPRRCKGGIKELVGIKERRVSSNFSRKVKIVFNAVMSKAKLSSNEVPQKFVEWILSMGCPPEKCLTVEQASEMCRGQYLLVWRSLMEHVQPKNIIKQKKLQVFCNDIKRCEQINEHESHVIAPEELKHWWKQNELNGKVRLLEEKVSECQQKLQRVMDEVSRKLMKRDSLRKQVQDVKRREFLLQKVAEELKEKKEKLLEAKSLAKSFRPAADDTEIQVKLDKYLSSLGKAVKKQSQKSTISTMDMNSTISNIEDIYDDEQLSTFTRCHRDALWKELYARRSELTESLSAVNQHSDDTEPVCSQTERVLVNTTALHATLSLEVLQNNNRIVAIDNNIKAALARLDNDMSSDACDVMLYRCELARSEARVAALRELLEQLNEQKGVFRMEEADLKMNQDTTKMILEVTKAIEYKRAKLKKLSSAVMATERNMDYVRNRLSYGYRENIQENQSTGVQHKCIATLRHSYDNRIAKRKSRADLSIELDTSENSFLNANTLDVENPTFVDELKLYLKRFNLEKNRKLVLESGEKIWIFETLQSSLSRLHSRWRSENILTSLMCPSRSLFANLKRLIENLQWKDELEAVAQTVGNVVQSVEPKDVTPYIDEEERVVDNLKKRLNENIVSLQKTEKKLELISDDIKFWEDTELRKFISKSRTVDGLVYEEYEKSLLQNLKFN